MVQTYEHKKYRMLT